MRERIMRSDKLKITFVRQITAGCFRIQIPYFCYRSMYFSRRKIITLVNFGLLICCVFPSLNSIIVFNIIIKTKG